MTFPTLNATVHVPPEGAEEEFLAAMIAQEGEARVLLTPALAKAALSRNTHNRKMRQARVETLATDLRDGRWIYTGEGIAFDRNGVLLNGQHRNEMVVRTGIAAPVLMVFGLSPEAQKYIDAGASRTSADVISLMGYQNANEVNAVSAFLQKWERDNEIPTNSGRKATRGQRIEYVEDQGDRIVSALTAIPNTRKLVSRSILATLYARLIKGSPVEVVDQFLNTLVSGENLSAGDPILTARNTLLGWNGKKVHANKYFDLLVQAWNAWRRGESKKAYVLRGTLHAVEA